MKHISKTLRESYKKEKRIARRKPSSRNKKFDTVHPMQWFFDEEKKELLRRAKLEKSNKKNIKDIGGRPCTVDNYVVSKLEQAFSLDATQEEACAYANISRSALNRYMKKNPMFRYRIEQLKELPVLMLRESVLRKARWDGDMALKYLENKRNGEFSKRKDVKLSGTIKHLPKLDKEVKTKLHKNAFVFFGRELPVIDADDTAEDDEG